MDKSYPIIQFILVFLFIAWSTSLVLGRAVTKITATGNTKKTKAIVVTTIDTFFLLMFVTGYHWLIV